MYYRYYRRGPFSARALRALRRAAKLSKAELASRANLSAQTIANLESGESLTPHANTRLALARVFGVDSEVLTQPDLYKEHVDAVRRREQRRRAKVKRDARREVVEMLQRIIGELARLDVAAPAQTHVLNLPWREAERSLSLSRFGEPARGGLSIYPLEDYVTLRSQRTEIGFAKATEILEVLQSVESPGSTKAATVKRVRRALKKAGHATPAVA